MEKQVGSFRLFQGFHLAFYSKEFYRYVAQHWKWRSLLHLVILLLILWALMVVRISMNFHDSAHLIFSAAAKQMPTLVLKDGVAKMQQKGTVKIVYPGTGGTFALINMKQTAAKLASEPTSAMVFITQQGISVRGVSGKLTMQPYPKNYTGAFGPKQLQKLYKTHQTRTLIFFILAAYFVAFPLFFAMVLLFVSVLTTLLSLIAAGLDRQLKWRNCFALACVAATPILTIFAIAFVLGAVSSLLLLVLLAAQFVYLIMATGFVANLYKTK